MAPVADEARQARLQLVVGVVDRDDDGDEGGGQVDFRCIVVHDGGAAVAAGKGEAAGVRVV